MTTPSNNLQNLDEKLSGRLKRQYKHFEDYCNAQTRLQNALIEEDREFLPSTLQDCVDALQIVVSKIQEDRKDLATFNLNNGRKQKILEEHISRSERIIKTIFHNGGKYHPSGIPASSDDVNMKTVAMATLRASLTKTQRKLGLQ